MLQGIIVGEKSLNEYAEASRLDRIAAATPASRDRIVDFLRAASIVAVVFGHWFIGIVWWQDGVLRTTSAVGVTTGLWLATWFFQVMPVFFFVGGFMDPPVATGNSPSVLAVVLMIRGVPHRVRDHARQLGGRAPLALVRTTQSAAWRVPMMPTNGANTPMVAQRTSSTSSPSGNRQW